MKVLIIGGCGYTGTAITEYLENKYNITSVDLEWFGTTKDNINLDYKDLTQEFLDKFSVVILLAGHSSVKMCDDRLSSYYNNVRNFVELTNKLSTQKFIYASSSSVYGNTKSTEISEENVDFSPINYYDMTKLHIDHIAQLSGLEYYGLRFGTVNGPAPHIRTDVMINAMSNTANEKGEIHVFNADTKRSILGINDLCRAMETIIEGHANPGIFNLASFTSTAGEIADVVGEVAGVPVINKDTPTVITNEKLEKKTYNFGVTTTKFENTFNFKFTDTLKSIATETVDGIADCRATTRSNTITYR
jgi:nucleoside-diphosphate-sugar epimerase|tara:strand:+ start:1772 stop:2683 length:912 start_codon:yes stop_codon:yes gene_type:complete